MRTCVLTLVCEGFSCARAHSVTVGLYVLACGVNAGLLVLHYENIVLCSVLVLFRYMLY